MTGSHKVGVVVTAIVFMLSTGAAYGDPAPSPSTTTAPSFFHLADPSVLTSHAGTVLTLPPGYWMDEPTFKLEDDKRKVEQDLDTRLTAENKSLRAAAAGWQPGWKTLATALMTGLAAGWYLHSKL